MIKVNENEVEYYKEKFHSNFHKKITAFSQHWANTNEQTPLPESAYDYPLVKTS